MSQKAPKPLRILLVANSETETTLVREKLTYPGYEPAISRVNAPETMAAALSRQFWDIVLAYDTVPGFRGSDALALLRKMKMDTPVILISPGWRVYDALAAVRAG